MNPRNRKPEPAPDRLPPHSMEAEMAVIGSILRAPEESMPTCIARIGTDYEAFYDLRHQILYETLVKMYDEREAIDLVTLNTWLNFADKLEQVGGMAYLAGLPDMTPSAANLPYYLNTVMEARTARKLIQISVGAVSSVYDHAQDVKSLVDATSQELLDLAQAEVSDEDVPMHPLVMEAINQIEAWHQNQGALTGVGSGYADLDRMTTGFQPGEMAVIAARPSMGKTSLAMNIVEHAACELGLSVGVFSMEMTRKSLVVRLICSRARVNIRNMQDGFLAERDFPKLTGAAGVLSHAPIHINDASGLTILGLRTRARKMHRIHGIKLLVIDYLQLMTADRRRQTSRQEEVSDISRGCKGIAKELNIPVIVLSQLNRQIEQDKSRRPKLSDLRESGAIEQDADLVAFLYKPEGEEEDHSDGMPVNLYVAKQRNGPTGDIPLLFLRNYCRFESAAHVSASDVPQGQYEPEPEHQQQMEY